MPANRRSFVTSPYAVWPRYAALLTALLLWPLLLLGGPTGLSLTPAERQWLAEHPIIRLAPDPDFQPIEFFDSEGRYRGLAADYIALIEQRLGIRFQIESLKNWDEAVAAAQARRVDMWGAASPTDERRHYMLFTRPMLSVPAVIINRHGSSTKLTLGDLKGKQVTVVSGYAAHDYLKQYYPAIGLDVSPDLRTALRRTAFGEVDAMIGNLATASHYMQLEGLGNLQVAGESGYHYSWALAVRSDWPELQQLLDRALSTISDAERTTIMDRWIHLNVPSRSWWQLSTQQQVILSSILALLTLIGILAWNIGLRRKVSERTVELERLIRQQELILNNSMIGILVVKQRKIVWSNPMMSKICGIPFEQLAGAETRILYICDDDYQKIGKTYQDYLHHGRMVDVEMPIRQGESGQIWIRVTGQALDNDHPDDGSIWLFADISEQRLLRRKLEHLANTDFLTNTLRRRAFVERAEEKMRLQRRYPAPHSLMMIDIDHFKRINDAHGHAAGDTALAAFADTCRAALREIDIIGRLGGEEFAVLLPNTDLAGAEILAARLLEMVRLQDVSSGAIHIQFTISIGLTDLAIDDTAIDQVLKRADDALYLVKQQGRDHYRVNPSRSAGEKVERHNAVP